MKFTLIGNKQLKKYAKKTFYFFKNRPKVFLATLVAIFCFGVLLYTLKDLPSPTKIANSEKYAVSTIVYDRHGTPLYEIFADENRIPIKIADLPPHVYQASIAIEDKNFYNHFGFDITGIIRALINNFKGETIEGGSTITQQLIKNALLTKEKSIQRKVKEGILAIFTEIIYSKEEILEMYLNYISYGGTSVGIESAAQRYFDKSAKDLTVAEAALLAGLPQAPSKYSPFGSNPTAAKNRQQEVIRRMQEDGYLTDEEAEKAKNEVLTFALSKTDIKAPHFVFYVRDLLYEEYGVETVEKGGLRVTTTLDLNIQNVAQASVSAEVADLKRYRVNNGAAMVVKPNTGEILAMVGSKDYFNATDEGQVNVTIAERQPGSSIKPLVYATTFQEGLLSPSSVLIDSPTCFTAPGQKPYCPKNYDGSFKGPVTIRASLGNSLNIPAVKAIRILGVEKFMEQARKMGLSTLLDPARYGLSLSLGGGEVKMIDMVQAFGVLANQGVKTPLTPFLKIENYKGEVLKEINIEQRKKDLATLTEFDAEKNSGELERVMDRGPAFMVADIMQDNKARTTAFGANSKLVIKNQIVSVKTGTTNDLKDNWTVGFTPEFLVMTWVGNNDSKPMSSVVSGVTGAAPIFNDIMTNILRDQKPLAQPQPESIKKSQTCPSGFPAAKNDDKKCPNYSDDYYWEFGKPSNSKKVTTNVWIDPTTGVPPQFGKEVSGLVLESRTFFIDPVTRFYCVDCNRPVDSEGKIQYEVNTVPHDLDLSTVGKDIKTENQPQTN